MKKEYKRWSEANNTFLKVSANDMTSNELSKKMDRTIYDIEKQAKILGVKLKSVNHSWSDEDIDKLRKIAYKHSVKELVVIFKPRTTNAIYKALQLNGIVTKKIKTKGKEIKDDYVVVETMGSAIGARIASIQLRRDKVLKQLNGRYNEDLYSQLNSLNSSLNHLKNIVI